MEDMKQKKLQIAETKTYLSRLSSLLNKGQDESVLREGIKEVLRDNPTIGAVIPRTSGVRKFRYAIPGKGKRGGYRIIYYYYDDAKPLFLLSIYVKSSTENLTAKEEKMFLDFVRLVKLELKVN